jgi:hypothetical protein
MSHSKHATAPFTLDGDTLPAHMQQPASTAPQAPEQGALFAMYRDVKPDKKSRHTAPTLMDWLSDNPAK